MTFSTAFDARRVNFTTKNLVCEVFSLHLHSLCVGILLNFTALGIHLFKTSLIFIFKTKIGGEICSCAVNLHIKDYWYMRCKHAVAVFGQSVCNFCIDR